MPKKFTGAIEELKTLLDGASIRGEWTEDSRGKHTFRSRKGGVLNWWPSKGTVDFQGSVDGKAELENAMAEESSSGLSGAVPPQISKPLRQSRQIFIVHGHDPDALDQLDLRLRRLGLEPFILMNSSGGGKTIIEALEGRIGRDFTSDFGIVLMTPDDVGYSKRDGADKSEPRARQNVILETGMLLSSLTRSRMAIVVKGHVEIPSDLEGIIRLPYNDHIKEVIAKLCQRLREAGFELNSDQIAAATQ
jgi:predicted nucleotide-binding protein